MIKEILIIIIAFSGFIFGKIIANHTKEEIKEGRKYFKLIEAILIIIIALTVLYYSFKGYNRDFLFLLAILIFIFGLVFGRRIKFKILEKFI